MVELIPIVPCGSGFTPDTPCLAESSGKQSAVSPIPQPSPLRHGVFALKPLPLAGSFRR